MDETQQSVPLWERQDVRADYEADRLLIRQVCRTYEITASELRTAIVRGNWKRRNKRSIQPGSLTRCMFRLLEQQLSDLEGMTASIGEKEVSLLGKLAGTLSNLIAIENKPLGGVQRRKRQTREMVDIRNRLIERIEQLKRQ